MAISSEAPGVEIAVTVGGNDVKEYEDDESDSVSEDDDVEPTVRYIEATSNETFAIRIRVDKKFEFAANALRFYVSMDGASVATHTVVKQVNQRSDYSVVSEGCKGGDGRLRKYQFTVLETASDNHQLLKEAKNLKDLGTIMVRVEQKKRISKTYTYRASGARTATPQAAGNTPSSSLSSVGIVSEKALKGRAMTHSIRFADPGPVPVGRTKPTAKRWASGTVVTTTSHTFENVSGHEEPVAVFMFKYRSHEALKSMLIIPRTPTPPPLEERDITTLSMDELRELQKRAKASKDKEDTSARIKREHEEEEPRPRKIARPTATSTQIELDDNGEVLESSTPSAARSQPEVIELD